METTLTTSSAISPNRRYTFIEYQNGFRIEGRERAPVEVHLSPNQTFFIVCDGRDPSAIYASLNLYAYPRLLEIIVSGLMQEWVPPAGKSYWRGAYLWTFDKAKQGVHYRVYSQWQRLLQVVPEEKRLVAKKVFAATFDFNRQGGEVWEEIYQLPFLVKDIIHYHAAAVACHYATRLADQSPQYLVREAAQNPGDVHVYHYHRRNPDSELHKSVAMEILSHDWKGLFAHDGKAHKSLCRTLMNLPGGINGSLLCYLPNATMWLNRPIIDRVELLTFLFFARIASNNACEAKWMAPVFAKVQREEVIAALHILSKHLHRELRPRRKDIAELVNYIYDYSRDCVEQGMQPHRGNLVGLVEKAIVWHRQANERWLARYQASLKGDTPAILPPIALPEDNAITFLACADDIFKEGLLMHHCIASYATAAVRGQCYLFHVEYQNTLASVMVNPQGQVVQSHGPHNSITAASQYGERVLSEWGRNFPTPRLITVDTMQYLA